MKPVRSDAILHTKLVEVLAQEDRQNGSGRIFLLNTSHLFALRRLAFVVGATTIRTSATLSVRAHANGIRVCAICRSFSRARRTIGGFAMSLEPT